MSAAELAPTNPLAQSRRLIVWSADPVMHCVCNRHLPVAKNRLKGIEHGVLTMFEMVKDEL